MKSYLNCILVSFTILQSANSASIGASSLPNLTGRAGDIFIINMAGDRLASGFAGLGGFNITDAAVAALVTSNDFSALISNFTPFIGTDNFVAGTTAALGYVPGAFTIAVDPFVVASPRVGQTLYSFIGNGTTLLASDQFALFMHNQTLAADPADPAPQLSYAFNFVNGTLVAGTPTQITTTDAVLNINTPTLVDAFRLSQAVPEPSALFLSAFGVFALLRRKR